MLRITRENALVSIEVDTGLGYNVFFHRRSEDELNAILLEKHLKEQLEKTVEEIKRNLYNKGYDHKTKKKPRETYFSTNIFQKLF